MTDRADGSRHALIVGASSGIGMALVQRLGSSGHVSAMARRIDRLTDLASPAISPIACDVTQLDAIPALVEAVVAEHGKLDALIYCAGTQLIKPMRITKVAEIQETVTVNLTAAIVFAKMFASAKIANADSVRTLT